MEFRVHKFVLNLFTDYFTTVDGVWIRINMPASHMEMMLYFMYHGQVGSFSWPVQCKALIGSVRVGSVHEELLLTLT